MPCYRNHTIHGNTAWVCPPSRHHDYRIMLCREHAEKLYRRCPECRKTMGRVEFS